MTKYEIYAHAGRIFLAVRYSLREAEICLEEFSNRWTDLIIVPVKE